MVAVMLAVMGASPPHTLTRSASATHPHPIGRKPAIGWQITPPAPAIARNDGGSCHPHTKKAETEGIAIMEYLYRIGRERRAKLYIDF
jgi:hypothetical protein